MQLTLSRSAPFRRLQARIGFSTYRLNTILVGLERIAAGEGDVGALAVTWAKPKSLDEARTVANQARIFACTSALVLGAEVFDAFIRDIAIEDWLGFQKDAQDVATKAKTRPKAAGGDYSLAERADALCSDLGLENQQVRIAALDLLAKWRNIAAHAPDKSSRLAAERRATLLDDSTGICERYSHLDIGLALKNFENGKMPVPKEVTTLVAIAVSLSRTIDEAAIKRAAHTEDKMAFAAEHMLRSYFNNSPDRKLTPWSELTRLMQRFDEFAHGWAGFG
jgi:hypothetical protein